MEEIKITLETLYDILRNEKKREDLQKLNETFFLDVVNYLKEKKSLLGSKENDDDLFSVGEKEQLEHELRSIKRILKEIYEMRENKIIDITLNKSRTKSDIIDISSMLKEEKDFYKQLIKLLDGYREGILGNLFKGEIPMFREPEIKMNPILEKKEPIIQEILKPPSLEVSGPVTNQNEKEKEPTESKPLMKKIKFTQPVDSFVWKDLKEYGPFEKDQETEIFAEVAELIIKKEHAVEI